MLLGMKWPGQGRLRLNKKLAVWTNSLKAVMLNYKRFQRNVAKEQGGKGGTCKVKTSDFRIRL